VRELGPRRAAAAAVLIAGSVMSALFWPVFALDTLWRAVSAGAGGLTAGREASDVFTYSLALAGVWTMVIPAIVAARQRGFAFAAKAIPLMPFYYILVSAAAWTAIADVILRPHYWAKTAHGRSRLEAGARARRTVPPTPDSFRRNYHREAR
jgi:glycosyltransferase XagB